MNTRRSTSVAPADRTMRESPGTRCHERFFIRDSEANVTGLSKFLLFAFIAIVLILGGLWLVGGKQRNYQAQIVIDAKPANVFPHLVEPNLRKKWVVGLQDARLQTDPPVQLDAQFRSVFRREDTDFEAEETVIRFDPGELVVILCRAPHAVITSVVRLESVGDMTRVSYEVSESLHGLARFQAAIAKSKMQDQVEREILALKSAVEAQRGSGILDDEGEEEVVDGDDDSDGSEGDQ